MITRTSLPNRILIVVFLASAVWAAIHQQWFVAIICVAALGASALYLRRARQGRGGELEHLDAAQPTDERESRMVTQAFAWVGALALILELSIFLFNVGSGDVDASPLRALLYVSAGFVANRLVAAGRLGDI